MSEDEKTGQARGGKKSGIVPGVGTVVEIVGKIFNWVGGVLKGGVAGLDRMASDAPPPSKKDLKDPDRMEETISQTALGALSGALDIFGSAAQETGELLQFGGKTLRGDPEALNRGKAIAKDVGQSLSYAQGTLCSTVGSALERAGKKMDNEVVKALGELNTALGRLGKELTDEEHRKAIDAIAEAGAHFTGRLTEKEGEALRWLADRASSPELADLGKRLQERGRTLRERTSANPLVEQVIKYYNEKKGMYRNASCYLVSKDFVRTAHKISNLSSLPESAFEILHEASSQAIATSRWMSDVREIVISKESGEAKAKKSRKQKVAAGRKSGKKIETAPQSGTSRSQTAAVKRSVKKTTITPQSGKTSGARKSRKDAGTSSRGRH